ncbi:hypothetical protein K737_300182 [Holospora undulata HU1]|uniref:Uncharacterized protein n=1 Tax=Holospora undulata HU1 TaxID=1321371 RepID=A0A061JIH5_9PROT|nr:hypothetical protein K737_300182 [Holospora undulata HU1]
MKEFGKFSKLMTIVAVAILYASITGLTQEHKGTQVDQR